MEESGLGERTKGLSSQLYCPRQSSLINPGFSVPVAESMAPE